MTKASKILKIIFIVFLFLAPVYFASAQLAPIPCPQGLNCSLGSGNGVSAVNSLILTVINWLLGFAFALAVLFLIIGGFWYITSGGDEESAAKAKSTIINAIIGLVIIILSYVIVNTIVNTLTGPANTGP